MRGHLHTNFFTKTCGKNCLQRELTLMLEIIRSDLFVLSLVALFQKHLGYLVAMFLEPLVRKNLVLQIGIIDQRL